MSEVLQQQPVSELIVCDQLDLATLESIRDSLCFQRDSEGDLSTFVTFDQRVDPEYISEGAPVEELREVAQAIRAYIASCGSSFGQLQMHATIASESFGWHADHIENAFVTSTEAATEGLAGTIPAKSARDVMEAVKREALVDQEFGHISTLKVVKSPLGSLLKLPFGVPHRSPQQDTDSTQPRLLVNGVAVPRFMAPFSNR